MIRRVLLFPVLAPAVCGFLFNGAPSPVSAAPPGAEKPQVSAIEKKNVSGTIAEITETGVHLSLPSIEAPVRYRFDQYTVFMDETGALIESETLAHGLTVTIRPTVKAGQLFARTVILERDAGETPPSPVPQENPKDEKDQNH